MVYLVQHSMNYCTVCVVLIESGQMCCRFGLDFLRWAGDVHEQGLCTTKHLEIIWKFIWKIDREVDYEGWGEMGGVKKYIYFVRLD